MVNTARSWNSFKETLIKVLAEFNPQTIMEWGPGVSTLIMQDYPSVKNIDTVEHDVAWFNKWRAHLGNKVNMIFEDDFNKYPYHMKLNEYDLYFVDGREREKCLELCNKENGIVILHDAERENYKPFIDKFKYIFMEDDGHTAVMTNRQDYEERLERIFEYKAIK